VALLNHSTSVLTLLLVVFFLAGCNEGNDQKPAAFTPPEVDIAQPLRQEITTWDEYIGRFEATNLVDIRSRVTGYLVEKTFDDGQLVKKGDVLFIIDPRPFQYEKQRAQAEYDLALTEYKRAENLLRTKAISREGYDRRALELTAAEASLKEANLNLEFTKVKSPINGKVSDDFINVGNLVEANDTLLTRVVTLDPIHFEFDASQTELLKYIRLDRAGKRPGSSRSNPTPVFIKLQDETSFDHAGRMDFVDNIVDPETGTIQARALVQNGEAIIYPGLFGRLRLRGITTPDALLLPEFAINTDQNRKFVYVVDSENKVKRRYVTLGSLLENGFIVIRNGLNGNENVVTQGLQRIFKPGQPVTPKLVPLVWKERSEVFDDKNLPSLSEIQEGSKDANTSSKTDSSKLKENSPETTSSNITESTEE